MLLPHGRNCTLNQLRTALSFVQDSVPAAAADVRSSDVLLCGLKLTYLEFVMSCIAIAADMVTKDEPLLTKVRLQNFMQHITDNHLRQTPKKDISSLCCDLALNSFRRV